MTTTVTPEQERRRKQIIETLELHDQPLCALEIAQFMNVGVSNLTKDLRAMTNTRNAKVFGRFETGEERAIRYGGTARAKRAMLYSTHPEVPPRTERVAVEGVRLENAVITNRVSTADRSKKLAALFAKGTKRSKYTARGVADKIGVPYGTVANEFAVFENLGLLKHEGYKSSRKVYTVPDINRLLDSLGQSAAVSVTKTPATPAPVTPEVPRPLGVDPRVSQVIDENEYLRGLVDQLRQELATANARAAELEKQVPAVDPRLDAWSPFV